MKYYVTGFMYSQDGKKVALIEKKQPAWQKELLNGIGGKIEKGETPEMAMSREFEEETGVTTDTNKWKLFSTIHREKQYKVYFFFCMSDKVFSVKTIEEEEIFIHDVESLPQNVISNLRWLIPMSLDVQLDFENPVLVEEIREER